MTAAPPLPVGPVGGTALQPVLLAGCALVALLVRAVAERVHRPSEVSE